MTDKELCKKKVQYLEGYLHSTTYLEYLLKQKEKQPDDLSIGSRIDQVKSKIIEIRDCILAVDNARYRSLLECRYIDNLSIGETSKVIGLCFSRTATLFPLAVRAITLPVKGDSDLV